MLLLKEEYDHGQQSLSFCQYFSDTYLGSEILLKF